MPFKKGQSGNPVGREKGGKSPGSGRFPDQFKAKCQQVLARGNWKILDFLEDVAMGEPFVEKISIVSTGALVEKTIHSAEIKDRLKAIEMLKDWSVGKSAQEIIHSGAISDRTKEEKEAEVSEIKDYLKDLLSAKK